MISGEAKAIPNRIPAHPHAFENVLSTMALGYSESLLRN